MGIKIGYAWNTPAGSLDTALECAGKISPEDFGKEPQLPLAGPNDLLQVIANAPSLLVIAAGVASIYGTTWIQEVSKEHFKNREKIAKWFSTSVGRLIGQLCGSRNRGGHAAIVVDLGREKGLNPGIDVRGFEPEEINWAFCVLAAQAEPIREVMKRVEQEHADRVVWTVNAFTRCMSVEPHNDGSVRLTYKLSGETDTRSIMLPPHILPAPEGLEPPPAS